MPASTKYKPEYAAMAAVACRLGAIDADLAELFGVGDRTIYRWKNEFPEFKAATESAKDAANQQVIQALFKRAVGCVTFKEVITKQGDIVELRTEHPPETAACMSWLYNRCRDDWKKDPTKIGGDGEEDNAVEKIAKALKEVAKKLPD